MSEQPAQIPEAVHILGIGGAGMSALARLLLARGVAVSGSDAKDSRRLEALRALGAQCHVGHDPANLPADVGAVIVSTAIGDTNVELQAARGRGIPVLHRSVALTMTMAGADVFAVAGTHGKTTTTSMLTVILQACDADPSFAIGSELNETGSNAHLGTGSVFVVEADESDGSFLRLDARVGIITNIEADHLNYWGTAEAMEQGFLDFATGIRDRGGFVVMCADDPGAAAMTQRARDAGVEVRTYGLDQPADYRITVQETAAERSRFQVSGPRLEVTAQVGVGGIHNVLNATAAMVAAAEAGFPADRIVAGIAAFRGTRRRFEFRGEVHGVRVFDDYAHHPTEIEATLRAARAVVGEGRIRVAFQAHHYYRTAMYLREFGQALGLADFVVILEVFAPGEEPIPGASGQGMAEAVPLPAEAVVFEPSWSAVAGHLARGARPGDLIMTLGAGDLHLLVPEILDLLATMGAD